MQAHFKRQVLQLHDRMLTSQYSFIVVVVIHRRASWHMSIESGGTCLKVLLLFALLGAQLAEHVLQRAAEVHIDNAVEHKVDREVEGVHHIGYIHGQLQSRETVRELVDDVQDLRRRYKDKEHHDNCN